MELTKHHGLGNDFLIAVEPARALDLTDAIAWCDRRRGVGADGLIELRSLSDGSVDSPPMWAMSLWNSDGSMAEVSGNGLRCVGQALALRLRASGSCSFLIRTDGGLRRVDVEPDRRAGTHRVRVDMGPAKASQEQSDRWTELGIEVIRQMAVSIGNPHLVALTSHPESLDLSIIGPVIETDFPDGINVHLIRVDSPTSITLRVWERGAGVTEACGSGACAAAWAANRWGLTGETVTVNMVGGAVEVEVATSEAGPGSGHREDTGSSETIYLTGPATLVGKVILGD